MIPIHVYVCISYNYVYRIIMYIYIYYIYMLYRWFSYIFPVNFGLIPSLQLLEDVAGNLSRRLRLGSGCTKWPVSLKMGNPKRWFLRNTICKYLLGIPLPNIGVPHILTLKYVKPILNWSVWEIPLPQRYWNISHTTPILRVYSA